MRTKTLLILSVALISTAISIFQSCKKEKNYCQGVTCQNGGTCIDGSCNCPPGYSGQFCQDKILCPVPTAGAALNITENSFVTNYSWSSNATYYLDVAKDAAFTNFVTGYNNLNIGNGGTYTVTGLTYDTYYYRVRSSDSSCLMSDNSNVISVTISKWVQKANFGGTARYAAVGFSIGTKGYIGTGTDGNYGTNGFWEWDQASNIWTQKADFQGIMSGEKRIWAVGFSIGTKGYIGTGNRLQGILGWQMSDFWEWDQATNIWIQKADIGGGGIRGNVGFSIGTKGYIGSNYFWEWNQASNIWTQKANVGGTARDFAVGFSIGSKGYIGMGNGTQDFWEWDQASNIWTQKANFGGTARSNAVGFSIGNKGYIGTGDDGYYENDFWQYSQ